MFSKKPKTEADPELVNKVDKDLIIHNMPSATKARKLSSNIKTPLFVGSKSTNTTKGSKKNFKIVGLVIILGGIIFIGILVYLSYIFLIKPAVNQHKPAINTNLAVKNKKKNIINNNPATSSVKVATSSVVSSTPINLETVPVKVSTINSLKPTTTSSLNLATSTLALPLDSDNDGLNNLEEAVLGTSPNSSDTDHDGYSDLTEVNTNHNPVGKGALSADPKLKFYYNKSFNYQILYPKAWPLSSINKGRTIIFTAPDNSLIQISIQDNSKQESITAWYKKLFPKVNPVYLSLDSSVWRGIRGDNGENLYLINPQEPNYVFIASYIPAIPGRVVYNNIFKLMVNSLTIK